MEHIKKIAEPFLRVAFPAVCLGCGESTGGSNRTLCYKCRYGRFEKAEHPAEEILPHHVHHLHSLWIFDKGGHLQNLLHQLKYNFMRGTGVELGRLLGKDFLDRSVPHLGNLQLFKNPVLIPIPLHNKKLRKRGFNQSEAIAEGIGLETDWPVISDSAKRIKRTTTQTGLNAAQRSANLKGAFSISAEVLAEGSTPMIVDDVFTTGTTTFELSSALERAGFSPSVIMTVAKA